MEKLIIGISRALIEDESFHELSIVVHYTIVEAFTDAADISTNSPEGIHQDGMDYIVSALVIERENITGGVSRVYIKDDETYEKILNVRLEQGQGIFQPDRNTNLWHEVSPIELFDTSKEGFRSTIGLDLQVVK